MDRTLTLSASGLVCLAISLSAGTLSFNASFQTSNQSMWNSGGAFNYNWAKNATVAWNESGSAGGISCPIRILGHCVSGYYGGQVSGHTDGEIGLALGAGVNAGSVDAAMAADFDVAFPDASVVPGSQFAVESSFAWAGGTLDTVGPNVRAYADLIFDVYAGGSAKGCVVGCVSTGNITLLDIDARLELLGFNRDGDGKLRLLESEMGLPFSTDLGYLEVTAQLPKGPNTHGAGMSMITSSGTSQLADLSVDITNVAAGMLGLPPLNGELDLGIAEVGYTTLGLTADVGLSFRQNFKMTPHLIGTLQIAETGQIVPMNTAGLTQVTFPNGHSTLTMTPHYRFAPSLANSTSFCFDGGVGLSALSLSLEVFGEGVFDVGPLYSTGASWPCMGGRVTVLDSSFALRGFNEFTGPSFTVHAVPEPTAFLLTGSALLAFCMLFRRRR